MRRRTAVLAALVAATPAGAETDLRSRIEALRGAQAPVITGDLYAEERERDLDRIAARAGALFPEGERIALFVGPDCAECGAARADLESLGQPVALHDTTDPAAAALHEGLGLEDLPAYVMADRLIRGHMPVFVLERYLSE
jgi:hypothetical protein